MDICQPGFTYTGNQCIFGLCTYGSFCNTVTNVCCSQMEACPAGTISDGQCTYGVCENPVSICLGMTCCKSSAAGTTEAATSSEMSATTAATEAVTTESTDAPTAEQCINRIEEYGENKWKHLTDAFGSYCIVFINEAMTWEDGKQRCANIPEGSLLHLRTEEGRQELLPLLKKSGIIAITFWLGLRQSDANANDKDWQWHDANDILEDVDVNRNNDIPWGDNEPSGGTIENCANYYRKTYKINDAECSIKFSIMCQFKLN